MTTTKDKPKEKELPRQEVKMAKDKLTMLKQMYVIRSYSGFEEVMRHFIIKELNRLNIPYLNFNGNIVGINHPGRPLLSAHMDMVNTESYKLKGEECFINEPVFTTDNATNLRLYRDKDRKNQTSLGADDKNGIWVILNLLQAGVPVNFLFCHGEEVGCVGSSQVVADEDLGKLIESCSFGIIIDRRNPGDIIGYENKYCMCLDDKIQTYAEQNGYAFSCARGSCSDADKVSQLLECVNLSCGYYDAHTSTEYTNLNELQNTLEFVNLLTGGDFYYESSSAKRMQAFKSCKSPYAKAIVTVVEESATEKKNKRWTTQGTSAQQTGSYKSTKTTHFEESTGSGFTGCAPGYAPLHHPDVIEEDDEAQDYDYAIELRTETDMDMGDYYDIVTSVKCPQCSEQLYILGEEVALMNADGYDLEDKTTDIGGECSGCGLIMNLSEVLNHGR